MKLVKSIQPLLTLFSIDTGEETAVETRPALPDWQPIRGNMVPAPGQRIDRVIRRVKQDRSVTIYEEEVIFINEPTSAPVPAPQPEEPYEFITTYGPSDMTYAEQVQAVADWHRGKARWVGGPPDPDRAIAGAYVTRPGSARIVNGRIVLQE